VFLWFYEEGAIPFKFKIEFDFSFFRLPSNPIQSVQVDSFFELFFLGLYETEVMSTTRPGKNRLLGLDHSNPSTVSNSPNSSFGSSYRPGHGSGATRQAVTAQEKLDSTPPRQLVPQRTTQSSPNSISGNQRWANTAGSNLTAESRRKHADPQTRRQPEEDEEYQGRGGKRWIEDRPAAASPSQEQTPPPVTQTPAVEEELTPFSEVSFCGTITVARHADQQKAVKGAKGPTSPTKSPNAQLQAATLSRRVLLSVPALGTVWVGDEKGHLSVRDNVSGAVVARSPLPSAAAPSPSATASRLSKGLRHPLPNSTPSTHHKFGSILSMVLVEATVQVARDENHAEAQARLEVWVGTGSGTLLKFSADGATLLDEAPNAHSGAAITTLGYLKDADTVVSGAEDSLIKLWPTAGQIGGFKAARTLRGHQLGLTAFAAPVRVFPEVAFASASYDSTVNLWSEDLDITASLVGHEGAVLSIVFVVGGNGGVVTSPTSANKHHRSSASPSPDRARKLELEGGTTPSRNTSRDILWSGGEDGTIRLWDPLALECLRVLDYHQAPVVSLICNEGEYKVWSASSDGVCLAWDPTTATVLSELQQGRSISRIFPVAKASVWRLWVCGDDGLTNCYLSQTVDESIEGQHTQRLLDDAMNTIRQQHAQLFDLSRSVQLAENELHRERTKFDKELTRMERLQEQLRQASGDVDDDLQRGARLGATDRNQAGFYELPPSGHVSPERDQRRSAAAPHSPNMLSGYTAAMVAYFDVSLVELEDLETATRNELIDCYAFSTHELYAMFCHAINGMDALFSDLEKIEAQGRYFKQRLKEKEAAWEEEISLLKQSSGSHPQQASSTYTPHSPAPGLLLTSPPPPPPLCMHQGDEGAPKVDQGTMSSPMKLRTADDAELQALHQIIRDLQQDLFEQKRHHAERLSAIENERVRELAVHRENALKDKKRLEQQLMEMTSEVEAAKRETEQAKREARRNDDLINEMKKERQELTAAKGKLDVTVQELQNELTLLRSGADSIKSERMEKELLERDLATEKEKVVALLDRLAALEADTGDAELHYHQAKSELSLVEDRSRQRINELLHAQEALKEENARFRQDLLSMKAPWESMKSALRESHEALEVVRAQCVEDLATLEGTIEQKDREIASLKKALSAVQLGLPPSTNPATAQRIAGLQVAPVRRIVDDSQLDPHPLPQERELIIGSGLGANSDAASSGRSTPTSASRPHSRPHSQATASSHADTVQPTAAPPAHTTTRAAPPSPPPQPPLQSQLQAIHLSHRTGTTDSPIVAAAAQLSRDFTSSQAQSVLHSGTGAVRQRKDLSPSSANRSTSALSNASAFRDALDRVAAISNASQADGAPQRPVTRF
jgi:WD40 repeat protein